MKQLFDFPNPVNEKTARTVAAFVAFFSLVGLVTGWSWLLPVMAAGFWLRVASGPRFSPVAILSNRAIAPRLGEPRMVPGPPKRFAQTIGAVLTTTGAVLVFAFGIAGAAPVVFGIMAVFATLESAFGLCVGCQIFAALMRFGVIPQEICEECNKISLRRAT